MNENPAATTKPCAMWCTACGVRLAADDVKGWGCPKCGHTGIPCDPAKDVTVEVNWHELHILCCWAERWAEKNAKEAAEMPRTVYAIARRLQNQWPKLGRLTLAGEIAELPDTLAERGITVGNIESSVPAPRPVLEIGPGAVGFAKRPNGCEPIAEQLSR